MQSPVHWAAEVLASGEDILIPVRELWLRMQSQCIGTGLSEDAFATLLEGDDRFEFLEEVDHGQGGEEERAVMEELGFYGGQCVKMRDRDLTPEYVTHMLRQSTQSMLDALEGAWNERPDGDLEAERELLEILTMAQRLKHEVDSALEEAGEGSESVG